MLLNRNTIHSYRNATVSDLDLFRSLTEDLYAPGSSNKITRMFAEDPGAFRVHAARSQDYLSLAGGWRANSMFGTMILYFPPRGGERDMILMNERLLAERGYSVFVSPVLAVRDIAPFLDLGFESQATLHFFKKTRFGSHAGSKLSSQISSFLSNKPTFTEPASTDKGGRGSDPVCELLDMADLDKVLALDNENFLGFWAYDSKDLQDLLSYAKCLVIKVKDDILGFVIFSMKGALGNIIRISVRKNVKRKGYGTKLLDSAISVMRSSGVREIGLCTQSDNLSAHGLYRKLGFRRSGDPTELLSKEIAPKIERIDRSAK